MTNASGAMIAAQSRFHQRVDKGINLPVGLLSVCAVSDESDGALRLAFDEAEALGRSPSVSGMVLLVLLVRLAIVRPGISAIIREEGIGASAICAGGLDLGEAEHARWRLVIRRWRVEAGANGVAVARPARRAITRQAQERVSGMAAENASPARTATRATREGAWLLVCAQRRDRRQPARRDVPR